MQVQRDEHDGLAEPHVVGEHAAQAELDELGHPAQAVELVVAQRAVERGRLRHRRALAALDEALA